MNVSDLVDEVARTTRRPRSEAKRFTRAVIEAIRTGLHEDGRVEIATFGALEFRDMKPKRGRDWSTGEPVEIPARRVVRFQASRGIETGRRSPFDWRKPLARRGDHAAALSSDEVAASG